MSTSVELFWTRVHQASPAECWPWISPLHSSGYGLIRVAGRPIRAHRFSYELHVGPIPVGLVVDHLCRNKRCVNPNHLEAVTQAENVRRDHEARGVHGYAAHCKNGHELAGDNVYRRGARRECRACKIAAESRRWGRAA